MAYTVNVYIVLSFKIVYRLDIYIKYYPILVIKSIFIKKLLNKLIKKISLLDIVIIVESKIK